MQEGNDGSGIKNGNLQAPEPKLESKLCYFTVLRNLLLFGSEKKCVCCSLVQIQVQSSITSAYNSRNTSVLELLCVHSNFHREQTWNSGSGAFIWDEVTFGLFGIVLNCVSIRVFWAVRNSLGLCIKDSR